MTRQPLTRMDIDTRWAYHRKCRALQAAYPQDWPDYWCAYQALLGESWATGERVTLSAAWVPTLPCTMAEATAALDAAGLIDKAGRIPRESWREWVEPAIARVGKLQKAASAGGRSRAAGAAREGGRFAKSEPSDKTLGVVPGLASGERGIGQRRTSGVPAAYQPSAGASPALTSPTPTTPANTASQPRQPLTARDLEDDGPEFPVLAWLSQQGVTIPPNGNGFHRRVVVLVGRYGAERVQQAMAGAMADGARGDRAIVFGAENRLDPPPNGAHQPKPPKGQVQGIAEIKAALASRGDLP